MTEHSEDIMYKDFTEGLQKYREEIAKVYETAFVRLKRLHQHYNGAELKEGLLNAEKRRGETSKAPLIYSLF
jgi:hypothetical protein